MPTCAYNIDNTSNPVRLLETTRWQDIWRERARVAETPEIYFSASLFRSVSTMYRRRAPLSAVRRTIEWVFAYVTGTIAAEWSFKAAVVRAVPVIFTSAAEVIATACF